MKNICFLLIIIFTFSCSSEEENIKEENNEIYKIYKIKSTNEEGNIIITEINYKNNLLDFIKEVHNSNETIIENYNYNTNGQIISITSDSGFENTFSYTGSNITKQNYSNDSYDEYTYDSNNNVKSKKIYRNNQFLFELLYEYDNKNNMVKITELNSGQTSTSMQTFDDKKNPFLNVLPKELLVINQLNGENNVLKSYDDETFVYEYNDKDYPTKQTIYESGNLESIIEFEYK